MDQPTKSYKDKQTEIVETLNPLGIVGIKDERKLWGLSGKYLNEYQDEDFIINTLKRIQNRKNLFNIQVTVGMINEALKREFEKQDRFVGKSQINSLLDEIGK